MDLRLVNPPAPIRARPRQPLPGLRRVFLFLFLFLFLSGSWAQIPGTALKVSKTGAIVGPVSAATFKSINSLGGGGGGSVDEDVTLTADRAWTLDGHLLTIGPGVFGAVGFTLSTGVLQANHAAHIFTGAAGTVGLQITGAVSQTANLLEIQDNSDVAQVKVTSAFNLDLNGHRLLNVGNSGISFSGTGAADTRTALSLVVGTNVQAYDADLTTYAGITPTANVQSLLGAADYSAMRTLLGLVIGTNVQAYDADLTTYAGITPSANVQTLLGAADFAAFRTSLSLTIGTNVQAYDADLTTYAGITPSANVQSLLGAADYSAMRTLFGLTIGTNVQAYDADLTTYAGITPSANTQSFLGAANFSAMRTLLGLVISTDVQAYDADLTTYAGITPSANVQTLLGAANYAAFRTSLSVPGLATTNQFTGQNTMVAPAANNTPLTVAAFSGQTANLLTLQDATPEDQWWIDASFNIQANGHGLLSVGSITASGSGAMDFSSGSGLFKTTTGANTLNGAVTVNAATTPSITLASGKTNTGFLTVSGKTSGSLKITTADATAQAITLTLAAQTSGASILTIPDQAGTDRNFVFDTLAQTLSNKTLVAPALGTPASGVVTNLTGTASININGTVGATTPAAGNFTTLNATGLVTTAGASIVTPNSMGALVIDVAKRDNAKSVSADTTFTFSGVPSTNSYFGIKITNGGGTARTMTLPVAVNHFSEAQNGNITTVTLPASGYLWLVWYFDGSVYRLTGDPPSTSGTGSFALTNGATFVAPILGTPASVTLTNGTGLPIATGISGLGTGIATALAVNTGSAGAPILFNGAAGTPSSLTGTNITGVPIATGISGLGSNVAAFLATASSANFFSALADETGSGLVVGATKPTIDSGVSMVSDDIYNGIVRTGLNNSGGVTQWDAVYLNSSSAWVLADANGSGTFPCRGIAVATASTGNATTILTRGTIRNDAWSWTPGGNIYLSTTAGGLTQTPPATTGDKVQVIGYALDADTMAVEIGTDYGTAP